MDNLAVTAALRAAKMGFPVFPADPNTKRPLVKGWPDLATLDPEEITKFWLQFPNAMIGALTGEKSGYFTVDIDVKNEECPFDKLKSFEAVHGERLIPVFATKTGSGGLHLFLRMPTNVDIRNSASQIAKGFDIRANGGYVIFAGSTKSDGNQYQFINFMEAYNA